MSKRQTLVFAQGEDKKRNKWKSNNKNFQAEVFLSALTWRNKGKIFFNTCIFHEVNASWVIFSTLIHITQYCEAASKCYNSVQGREREKSLCWRDSLFFNDESDIFFWSALVQCFSFQIHCVFSKENFWELCFLFFLNDWLVHSHFVELFLVEGTQKLRQGLTWFRISKIMIGTAEHLVIS